MAYNGAGFIVQVEEASPGILGDRFERASQSMREEILDMSANLSQRWVAIAREEAPKETGRFSSEIGAQVVDSGNEIGFDAFSPRPLGGFINYGTSAHGISPRSSRGALTFYWENGPKGPGVYHFYHVNHPGTKPNPYFLRALDRFNEELAPAVKFISEKFLIDFTGSGSY